MKGQSIILTYCLLLTVIGIIFIIFPEEIYGMKEVRLVGALTILSTVYILIGLRYSNINCHKK